jgi:hypothetical protein
MDERGVLVFEKTGFLHEELQRKLTEGTGESAKVQPAMTRAQVREVMKDCVFVDGSFSERYYLHPNIILEVPF